ncbi:MAG: hypothetical protein KIT73_04615 [Burkholderiales bacterium]|nr:hypothetical protein [Burkholderiales bacterium]
MSQATASRSSATGHLWWGFVRFVAVFGSLALLFELAAVPVHRWQLWNVVFTLVPGISLLVVAFFPIERSRSRYANAARYSVAQINGMLFGIWMVTDSWLLDGPDLQAIGLRGGLLACLMVLAWGKAPRTAFEREASPVR